MATAGNCYVDVKVSSKAPGPLVSWCTLQNASTQVFDKTHTLSFKPRQTKYCLITVLQANDRMQIRPVMACLLMLLPQQGKTSSVARGHIKLTIANCCAQDCTRTWRRRLHDKANAAVSYFRRFVKQHELVLDSRHHTSAYCNPVMMEADMFLNGEYSPLSTMTGWPQCGRITVSPAHFMRSIVYACILTKCDTARVALHGLSTTAADVLISVCLTAFAGNYPANPELVDDRTCGELKLCTNRDCDDMAITVCGVFNSLKRWQCKNLFSLPDLVDTYGNDMVRTAQHVLTSMNTRYQTAACVVCEAVPHIANPNIRGDTDGKTIGHVFAVLSPGRVIDATPNPKLFCNSIVIESTRQSSPHESALDTLCAGNSRIFCRDPVYNSGQQGVQCVKPFYARQYPYCMAAYTDKHSFLLTDESNRVGVPIASLQDGSASCTLLSNVPPEAAYCGIARSLCHKIDYDQLDSACLRNRWDQMLKLDAGAMLNSEHTDCTWDYAVNPVQHGAAVPLCLSRWTAYGFI